MFNKLNNDECTGCNACVNICPMNAIKQSMQSGFNYPTFSEKDCINCHLCEDICTDVSNLQVNTGTNVYAAQNLDSTTLMKSSSGGIFAVISKEILDNNGIVIGARLNDNVNVEHSIVTNIDELSKLLGSKYVQSDIGDIYRKVKSLLEENKLVLFSGTACQIAGLQRFLKKNTKTYIQLMLFVMVFLLLRYGIKI